MSTDANSIRQAFVDYFRERGHEVVSSGPLVPQNDPTLMFANAGMVPFKDVFTGKDKRSYSRATSSQKCIRISGKHNDLENVGVTARHHTFFEMLGNFSFGDYFKRDAISYAWDFITRVMEVPKDRLVVTVFGGEEGMPADDEAAGLWSEIAGLPDERIIRCGAKDNFWQMGDTGPCGPCSEIHYFVGEGDADPQKFGEEPRPDGTGWTELWNLVFMQFDRQDNGEFKPLPAPSIDTGMGLERLAVVRQGKTSNYDTDLLRPVVDLAATLSNKTYGGTLEDDDVSMRVIADHARTTAMLIAEGIFPDRDGRAYVLRRVMRRAIRHGHRLGIDRPFLHEAATLVADRMGDAFPELLERRALIEEITRQEEERFRRTLKRGLDLLAGNEDWVQFEGKRQLPGKVAFLLYDTYGFPLDLQEVIGREQNFGIDQAGFEQEMQQARERSAGSKVGEKAVGEIYLQVREQVAPTRFTGYEREQDEGAVLAIICDGARVEAAETGQEVELISDRTPFYGESGGQVGDTGELTVGDAVVLISDTQKPVEGLIVHHGRVKQGRVQVGDRVKLTVDHAGRSQIRRNHSATHLLHYALRSVLGPQAMQKGSLVGPDRLRFDYSAGRPLAAEELIRIEDLVNAKIMDNAPIETEVLPMDEAKAKGAIGIFEEKYGAVVRMLRMTNDSVELCGGTHAGRTGDIGLFKILSDSGLAAGVRRIEAATGWNAIRQVRESEAELGAVAGLLKAPTGAAREKVQRVLEHGRALEKEVEGLKQKLVSGTSAKDPADDAREIGGVRVLGLTVELGDAKSLRELADRLRDKLSPAVILLGTETKDGKAMLVCTVSKDLTKRFQAGGLVKEVASLVGGAGGGRPDFAQAGGSDPSRLREAVERVYDLVAAAN